jgi:NitT/TauT family transport system substrate-binding protein
MFAGRRPDAKQDVFRYKLACKRGMHQSCRTILPKVRTTDGMIKNSAASYRHTRSRTMQKIALTMMSVIFIMSSIGSAVWPLPSSETTDSANPDSIIIGIPAIEHSALIYIAEDQGFFAGNGLNVTTRDYTVSPEAMDGLLNNVVDIASIGEYTLVDKAFKKEKIRVIGNIDKFETTYLIGRKDKGIENISDLKAKRIGLTRGTLSEFYLGRLLDLNDISFQDATLVDLPSTQYVQALTNGSIDALVASKKYKDQIERLSGANVVAWPAQSNQPGFVLMTCRDDWVANHPETINKLLRSLVQAERYSINHPDAASAIVQKRLNYTDEYIATVWPNHRFTLSLDQSLLIVMNDEGRWMIKNNLTAEKALPYLGDYIYTKGLDEIKPEAVNIK